MFEHDLLLAKSEGLAKEEGASENDEIEEKSHAKTPSRKEYFLEQKVAKEAKDGFLDDY